MDNMQRMRDSGVLSSEEDVFIKPSSQGLFNYLEEKVKKS